MQLIQLAYTKRTPSGVAVIKRPITDLSLVQRFGTFLDLKTTQHLVVLSFIPEAFTWWRIFAVCSGVLRISCIRPSGVQNRVVLHRDQNY
jgi:hypothetical protein